MNLDFTKPLKIEIENEGVINACEAKNGRAYFNDVEIEFLESKFGISMQILAKNSLISHIYLTYELEIPSNSLVYGDAIERGYGDLSWSKKDPDRQMFWYFFVYEENKKNLYGLGVGVQPHSIVSFYLKDNHLLVDVNVQSGGSGVNLENRVLNACTFIQEEYLNMDLFKGCQNFVNKLMMDVKKALLKENVYGFNNWYYAYGNSSYKQIMKDTVLLEEVTKGNKLRPYMVIDDGWTINTCSGPWIPNSKFKDMKALANEIREHNIKPGIWLRPLMDVGDTLKEYRHPLNKDLLDPTVKEVKEYIAKQLREIVSWGYELIKFDYVTDDIYLKYGFQMPKDLCEQGFRFHDNHFTNAEIILDLYNLIRESCKGAVLIGCNAISHLCAGIVELNRIGDDTSGEDWDRTRKYGVNSLAFRMIQNDIFYKIDGDCVGITGKIDWKQNKEWLRLLSKSGSPLFVSCDPDFANEEIKNDLKEAFKINEKQDDSCVPLDWTNTLLPSRWLINEKEELFNWFITK